MPVSVRIIPLGKIDCDVLEEISAALAASFGADVTIDEAQPHPNYAFAACYQQFSAPKVIYRLATDSDGACTKTLGVTDVDLFAPETNYVFGEAQMDGEVAIISLYRLQELDRGLFLERAGKEAIHEIGHTLNLEHCDNDSCVMRFSHTIEDTDVKSGEFCEKCRVTLGKSQLALT